MAEQAAAPIVNAAGGIIDGIRGAAANGASFVGNTFANLLGLAQANPYATAGGLGAVAAGGGAYLGYRALTAQQIASKEYLASEVRRVREESNRAVMEVAQSASASHIAPNASDFAQISALADVIDARTVQAANLVSDRALSQSANPGQNIEAAAVLLQAAKEQNEMLKAKSQSVSSQILQEAVLTPPKRSSKKKSGSRSSSVKRRLASARRRNAKLRGGKSVTSSTRGRALKANTTVARTSSSRRRSSSARRRAVAKRTSSSRKRSLAAKRRTTVTARKRAASKLPRTALRRGPAKGRARG